MNVDDKVFNLLAPIAIYHFTDVRFECKAQRALARLKREFPAVFRKLQMESVDDSGDVKTLYNDYFETIVTSEAPGWTWNYDPWGSRQWKTEHGQVVFSGDDYGFHPWYEDAGTLRKRVQERVVELEEDWNIHRERGNPRGRRKRRNSFGAVIL